MTGFKSFAQTVQLGLEPGVTAVVGPNGSGKSNIVDAVRWVLGEQSARVLRGAKSEDVIFGGSAGRPRARFVLRGRAGGDRAARDDAAAGAPLAHRRCGRDPALRGAPCRDRERLEPDAAERPARLRRRGGGSSAAREAEAPGR